MVRLRLRILLFPFSLIFAAIATIRNVLFDIGILASVKYSIPVISVGNLTVGGTGKTPLTELIIRHLEKNKRCALLSRGYGRQTKGVIIANETSDYSTIGDEPFQVKSKFKNLIVAVAEKRRRGMDTLLNLIEKPQVVVLDDAFQHRYVKPGLSLLVMDYYRPVWKDLCLPAGNLREPKRGIKRADLIVVNKCPDSLSKKEALFIQHKLKVANEDQIFFTSIKYGNPVPLKPQPESFQQLIALPGKSIVAVAGIGNPKPFFKMTENFLVPVKKLRFPDHHDFSITDIKKMEQLCSENDDSPAIILTTEKDAQRLAASKSLPESLFKNIWYIPIELVFLFDAQNRFNSKLDTYVGEN